MLCFETYLWYSRSFHHFHMISASKCNIYCISIPFLRESELTSSASPIVVFHSILNAANLSSENLLPLTHCFTSDSLSESTFKIESIEFNIYFSNLILKTTECYRRVKNSRAILSVRNSFLNMQYKSNAYVNAKISNFLLFLTFFNII